LRAATLGAAAAAVEITLDRHVVAAVNGDQMNRDARLPLVAGDTVAFRSADAGEQVRWSCCADSPISSARSSRSARTTRCSTCRVGAARDRPLITLDSSNVGSLGGLVALRDGLCHLAGSHLLDPAGGEYTLPYLDRIFGAGADTGNELAVVRLVHRDQGLLVAPGNPLRLTGIADLTRPDLRHVNRQRGAGTRVPLDHELGRLGVVPATISGYSREEHTHLGVAAAVAAGRADTGLGIHAAAQAFELDFVPGDPGALRPRAPRCRGARPAVVPAGATRVPHRGGEAGRLLVAETGQRIR